MTNLNNINRKFEATQRKILAVMDDKAMGKSTRDAELEYLWAEIKELEDRLDSQAHIHEVNEKG